MATMTFGLGGPAGYGENVFSSTAKTAGNNDDGSVAVDITSVFGPSGINFFGTNYTDVYINSNGLLTFDGPETAYSPSGISGLSDPAIAPFWSDVDINKGGEIYWDLDPGTGNFTITWLNVAPYTGSGANSFQVVLRDTGGGDFDVEFVYEDITWSDGGYGTATAGITDGGSNDFEVAGSGNGTSVQTWDTADFDGAGSDPSGIFARSIQDGSPRLPFDGSSSNDILGLGSSDTDGDQITTGDDSIEANAGNDLIDGDAGSDTILGGSGDDTILTGSTDGGPAPWAAVGQGANVTGSTGSDYYQFTGQTATIRLNNSAGANDGDGVADYLWMDTGLNTTNVTVGDFEMGTDKIVIDQMWSGSTITGSGSGFTSFRLTYSSGLQQDYTIYHQGSFSLSDVFTTIQPTVSVTDDDSLSGGDDADTFILSDHFGRDTIVGGEGGTDSDTIDASGLTSGASVTYTGNEVGTLSSGDDTLNFSEVEDLTLTDQADTVDAAATTTGIDIDAGTGADSIEAGSGADTIEGGSGHDTIEAGGGNDFVTAGSNNDLVYGEAGSDTLDGGVGSDTIYGGDDGDLIYGGGYTGNADELYGGSGDDTVYGGDGAGNDQLFGETGDDYLDGRRGADTLSGGTGSDTIVGGDGDDEMLGGDDADTFLIEDSFDHDTIVGGEGGTDADAVDLRGLTGPVTVSYSGSEAGTITDGSDTITFSEIENIFLTDLDDSLDSSADGLSQTVDAGAGNDTIVGSFGDHNISGGAGDDELYGGSGDSTLDGGSGDDTLYANYYASFGGSNIYVGGADTDTFVIDGTPVQSFDYNINLNTGVDNYSNTYSGIENVVGGDGDDTLTGDGNANSLDGGDGADSFRLQDGFGADTITGGEGGTDSDTIELSGLTGLVTVTYSGDEAGTIADGSDALTFSEIEQVALTERADSVDASSTTTGVEMQAYAGNDTVVGGSGADTISGGTGDDSIEGGDGDDVLRTGQGNDTLDGGAGADTLLNSAGDDSLVGGAGDDLIVATAGNDTLEGGDGNDTLMGGTDNDSLDGGADNDLLLGDLAGVAFNATGTDGVGLASNITDFPTTQVTYEITLASTDTTGDTSLGSYAVSGQDNEFSLQLQANTLAIYVGGSFTNTGIPAANFLDGNVNTLAVSWDSATGALEVYINGASSYSGTTATGTTLDTGGTFALGQDQDSVGGGFDTGQAFEGTVYGVRLYDDVRTPGEILDSALGPVADTSDPNLVANWVADPDSATFTDQTGSHTMAMAGDVGSTWSEGDDTLLGGAGGDTIYGGGGEDNIFGGGGDDIMSGDDDADTFIIEDGFGNDTITGGEGGTDSDTIDLTGLSGPVTVTYSGDESGTIADGTDTASFSQIETITLGDSSDSVDGTADSAGLDIVAGNGNDSINGGTGNDSLQGGGGADWINGGAGNDTILGGTGADVLDGSSGNDSISGGAGGDVVWDEAGDSTLDGGSGNDMLSGGTGQDSLTGGSGDDTFYYDAGDGDDTITDFNSGNSGSLSDGDSTNNDFIDLSAFYDNLQELYADQADDGVLNQSNTVDAKGRSVDYSNNSSFGSGSMTFSGASADNSFYTEENTASSVLHPAQRSGHRTAMCPLKRCARAIW